MTPDKARKLIASLAMSRTGNPELLEAARVLVQELDKRETAEGFIKSAGDAIERCGAPIIYLHKDGKTGAFAAIIGMTALGELDVRGEKVTEEAKQQFWMRHSHIEPGMW